MRIPQSVVPDLPRVQTGRFKAKSYEGDYMKAGKLAEAVARDWLTDHPDVLEVRDVSELAEMQLLDGDLTIRLREGGNPLAEVKWDRHLGNTGNVLIEVLRMNHFAPPESAGVLGWTLRTEARWIMYYAPTTAYVYQFKTSELRRCLQRYTGEARAETQWTWISTDRVKSTVCILLPLKYCIDAFRVHDVIAYARRYFPGIDQKRLEFAPESLHF